MLVGFVMTFDNILAVILLPYIGFLSDNTRTKIGRRKPYILVGAPLGALFFMLIPVAKDINIIFMIISIIIMNVSMALFRSPVIALMPDITPSKSRSKANGMVNFMGGFGALLAFFVGSKMFDQNQSLPFYIGGLALLMSALLVLKFVKEPKEFCVSASALKNKTTDTKTKNISFKAAFSELTSSLKTIFSSKEKSELKILLAIFFWFCGFGAIETFFTLYGVEFLGITAGEGAFILGIFSLSFMIFAFPAGIVGTKIGRKKTILMGLALLIIMQFTIVGSKDLLFIKIMMTIGGIGWAMININSLPMVVDMVSDEEVGGHTGLYYFFSMLAAIVSPPLVGLVIDMTNYSYMVWFSLTAFAIALLFMLGVKRGEVKKGD